VRAAGALLALATVVGLWVAGGTGALLYSLLFVAAVAPGIPVGLALFGRRHPAAWIAGALIGYGLTQLTLWAVIAAGVPGPFTFTSAWVLVLAGAIALTKAGGPDAWSGCIEAPAWTSSDLRALFLVLLLVPVLMGITYRNVGRADAEGNKYYRAYFTADFLWHTALASELGKYSVPPRNPYLAPRAMNYYWTYFLLPATVAREAPAFLPQLRDVQQCLKANAILAGFLMMGALFLLVRCGVNSPWPAAVAVVAVVLAASAEGLYAIADLLMRGRPLIVLQDTNIDAISNWSFEGLRIDNIPRSLWYTPQHTTSIALGLVALTIAALAGARARPAAIAGAGLSLGLSTTMNPLLGAVCSLIYGICIVVEGIRIPGGFMLIARHAMAAVFVIGAVGWAAASHVMDGAGSVVDVGFSGFARNHPIITLMLSLGPVLLPAIPGILRPAGEVTRRAVVIGSSGILLGLFLLYFVRISEASWVGFRAGQILLVSIPVLLARTFELLTPPLRAGLAVLILLIGFPTTVVDTFNAQDIWNRRPGPGFRWTIWTTPDQDQAFAWIRDNTPLDAIVQMEPVLRGREHWTLIPSFAGRRMAAGDPISLLPIPEYKARSGTAKRMFETNDAKEGLALARRLRVDYIYVDQDDLAAYPSGTQKFEDHPELFERVFANGTVRLYRVR
jgi:hypothetical protein